MRIHILLFFLLFETFCKAQLPNYIPILVGDKYGFCDSNMNMLIEPQYDDVSLFDSAHYRVIKHSPISGYHEYLLHNETSDTINLSTYTWHNHYALHYYFFKNDSLHILPDTTNNGIISIPYGKRIKYRYGFSHMETNTPIYYITFYSIPSLFSKSKNKGFIVVSRKGIIYESKEESRILEGGYIHEIKDNKYALLRATQDSVLRLTGFDYDYLSPPNKFGISRALKASTIKEYTMYTYYTRKGELKERKDHHYSQLFFIDSLGNEFLSSSVYSYSISPSYYYSYNFNIDIEDDIIRFSPYNNTYLIFKDSITQTWPNIDSTLTYYYSIPPPSPILSKKIGKYYVIERDKKYNLVNNRGRKLLPTDYKILSPFRDDILQYEDSVSLGFITTKGEELLKVMKHDSFYYLIQNNTVDTIWISADGKRYTYLFKNYKISLTDSITYKEIYERQRIQDSIDRTKDTYWILRDKKVREEYNRETETYNVYCDSLLINPYMQIVQYTNHYNVLFVMKDKHNHTWIYDNNGKVVYNTDEDYEYEVRYLTSGKVNHFVITISTKWKRKKKGKFIADIHWPGFNGQPYYSSLPIERFIDSFTVVHLVNDYNSKGLLDKNNKLIIPPLYRDIEYKKYSNDSISSYLFFEDGQIFDVQGNIIAKGSLPYFRNSALGESDYYENGKEHHIFIDKYNKVYIKPQPVLEK